MHSSESPGRSQGRHCPLYLHRPGTATKERMGNPNHGMAGNPPRGGEGAGARRRSLAGSGLWSGLDVCGPLPPIPLLKSSPQKVLVLGGASGEGGAEVVRMDPSKTGSGALSEKGLPGLFCRLEEGPPQPRWHPHLRLPASAAAAVRAESLLWISQPVWGSLVMVAP